MKLSRQIYLTLALLLGYVATALGQPAQISPDDDLFNGPSPARPAIASPSGSATPDAAADGDTIRVSFLTCSPGVEIHRLYGHTALRLQTPAEDWAVNFGWFSFNTPNFIMKFILGLTDYSMAYQTMPIFINDLMRDDMSVTEQQLNLTPEEALRVKDAMQQILDSEGFDRRDYNFRNSATGEPHQETILAARWTYRYNFLYDNCTTRAVLAIEEAVKACGETLVYPTVGTGTASTTQRTMIHEYTTQSPWYEFGQDLLLGPEVDEQHTMQELAGGLNFLPVYAQHFFQQAQIRDKEGKMRPLVSATESLTPFLLPSEHKPAVPVTPLAVAGILLGMALIITLSQRSVSRKAERMGIPSIAPTAAQRAWRIWGNAFDFTMIAAQTIVGILLVIMVGWSEHPAVGTNWLLLLFNPLFILGIPAVLVAQRHADSKAAHLAARIFAWFAIAMGAAIILVGVCRLQLIPVAIYPLALIPIVRAINTTRN